MRPPNRSVAPSFAVVVLLLLVAGACAAPGSDGATVPTTTLAPTTTTVGLDEVRDRFVVDAGADGALEDLADADLGCDMAPRVGRDFPPGGPTHSLGLLGSGRSAATLFAG